MTLPEMATALFLLVAVTMVALPHFTGRRILGNERLAVDWLKKLARAEQQFLAATQGKSYAFLGELLGNGRQRPAYAGIPRSLSLGSGAWSAGSFVKDGFCFVIYLADSHKRPLSHAQPRDDARAPRGFIAYAWPLDYGVSGRHVYAIDPRGTVFEYKNSQHPYGGLLLAPPPALLASTIPKARYPFSAPEKSLLAVRWQQVTPARAAAAPAPFPASDPQKR